MTRAPRLVVAAIACLLARSAAAADAEQRLHDAERRATAGEPGALDALEAVGREQPATIWTDDAWVVAARFAERAGDFARAERDLEQALAVTTDEKVARRARADLERLRGFAGASAQWADVASAHERLAAQLHAERGDPRRLLGELEALLREHPGYPRAAAAMLLVGMRWELEGEPARGRAWLLRARDAAPTPIERERATAELVRAAIRQRELGDARSLVGALGDPPLAAKLSADIDRAEHRRQLRWVLWGLLAVIAAAAVIALRRAGGGWRGAGRRLLRVPAEVLYFVPIALVLVVIAATGNPLVARAIRAIAIVGLAVAWISGAILDGKRAQLRLRYLALHAVLAIAAVVAASYLAIDRGRMIDLLVETWTHGPESR